jgi:glucan 1,3-beta-glucosidase
MLGHRGSAPTNTVAFALGGCLVVLVALAAQSALGLVFNPRYRDFPFAALTAAVVPFLTLMPSWPTRKDWQTNAETVASIALILCAIVIALAETPANWQALWFCAGLAALAVSLLPGRAAPG